MKTIGLIGGLGPEATADYYRRITSFFHAHNGSLSTPQIVIYSVDITQLFALVAARRWEELSAWLASKVAALASAGADFAAISANTPHVVFDRVQALSPLPLVSIVEATLDAARSRGLKRLGLLGTSFTMQENFFGERFAREGIDVVVPDAEAQRYIQHKLVTEIELGRFEDATRDALLGIVGGMAARENVDAVILGCTELPLILQDGSAAVPLLDTTGIHVAAICRRCLAAVLQGG